MMDSLEIVASCDLEIGKSFILENATMMDSLEMVALCYLGIG